jgi:hypothetical protein
VPVVLAVVAAIAVAGMMVVGVIGVVGFLWLSSSGTPAPSNQAGLPAGPRAASAPPPPPVSSAPEAPLAPPTEAPPAAAEVAWVVHEDSAKGFTAYFPGGQAEPIDPLAQVEDPKQRELAAAMTRELTMLGVTHGGRKFTLTAAPLNLSGAPPHVYLDRMAVGLRAIHAGFSLNPQPTADKTIPRRDYVLQGKNAGKLLRVIVGRGHVYQLLVEGEAGLAFTDPVAIEFFDRFQCAGLNGSEVAAADNPPSGKDAGGANPPQLPSEPPPAEVPDGIEWRPFRGKKFAFEISFPGVSPEEVHPLAPVAEEFRKNPEQLWSQTGVVVEAYEAQVDDRRYGITVFRDPNKNQEGSIRFHAQMESLLRSYTQVYFDEVLQKGVRMPKPPGDLRIIMTNSMKLKDGSKAIVRQAHLGHYGFVVRVEGPEGMDDLDPQVSKFLNSLRPPPDAAPIPLNVKPLPGPGSKSKPKTKIKAK